jgi:hypothetical protein
MNQSHRFQMGKLKGEIKRAETSDNPGELMIVGMPLVANVDMSSKGGREVACPLCGNACWASPHITEAAKIYTGRVIAACTECSLRANINKGDIPKRLHEQGISPSDILLPILNLFNN